MRWIEAPCVGFLRDGRTRRRSRQPFARLIAGLLAALALTFVAGAQAQDRNWGFALFGARERANAATSPTAALKAQLAAAYPGAFAVKGNAMVFSSGARVTWDDGLPKSADELLEYADVQDMFHWPYPLAAAGEGEPPRDYDPGRARSDPFFRALYGADEDAVRKTLRTVPWLGGTTMTVTTRFGVDRALEGVRTDLLGQPELARYLSPPAGSFLWRNVARTNRPSIHSFGAAVDINTRFADYWLWQKTPAGQPIAYRNRIPLAVVAAFERHCFIWGGRWYHYDTMHFEYRPELLPGCRRGSD